MEQELSWIPDFQPLVGITKPHLFYEGLQLDTRRAREGILLGYILRMADCSNMPEDVMVTRLIRACIEMVRAGHTTSIIRKTIEKTKPQLKCSTREAYDALNWSKEDQEVYCLCHDTAFRLW